ncbi:transposase [Bacillus infantis]|uniref:transposase n=1 Tax=Bacillus infantis TaxID=324767 RepID=UPI001CD6D0B2|nr:transposase [Bacillus infantis]MCA1041602.1 transposase [Bacillus infantis]
MHRRCHPFVGIDDFALLKGHTYGTLICDLETNTALDILPDRLQETLTGWLQRHPHVQVVSRDGYQAFRRAIREADPSIRQVYDRFHYVQNLYKHLDNHLLSKIPSQIVWKRESHNPSIPMTKQEERMEGRKQQKWELIKEVQAARQSGKNISQLSRQYSLDRRTIHKYLETQEPPETKRGKRKGQLEQFAEIIEERVRGGTTVKGLFEFIVSLGYKGTYSSIRMAVEQLRKELKATGEYSKEYRLARKTLVKYLWMGEKRLNPIEFERYQACIALFPFLEELHDSIECCRLAIEKRDYPLFLLWLNGQLEGRKKPFHSYALRLRSDLEAIKNSFLLQFSNGLLEGQVNRLKFIKRMMYGRASILILKKRMTYRL